MKIAKKLIPYLVYLAILLVVIVIAAIVTYWDQMAQLIIITLVMSAFAVIMLAILGKMISLAFR